MLSNEFMMTYKPPYVITPSILKYIQEIYHALGLIKGLKIDALPVKLRRINNIKTIQSSLSIEGNTLSIEQITDVFEGKRISGPQKDILEVKNALRVYKKLNDYDALSLNDFLKAHEVLMENLVDSNGKFRLSGVGIFKGNKIEHVAPPFKRVPSLMEDLFAFLTLNSDLSWLLKACIFHYELEFIHPFTDGNGRMGRLWQQLILMKENAIFESISVEEIIKENQYAYYDVLGRCDREGDVTPFIEFGLEQILKALQRFEVIIPINIKDTEWRLSYAKQHLEKIWFTRKDYMFIHKDISSATASRDLLKGFLENILEKKGSLNKVQYYFIENL